MAPGKKSDVDAAVENMREEVNKIGAMESTVEGLKESLSEIRSRMNILERLEQRLEQRLNEDDETRKREMAALFKASLQSQEEEDLSPIIQRPGKQIAGGVGSTETEDRGFVRGR